MPSTEACVGVFEATSAALGSPSRRESAIAEKFQAMVKLGVLNSRMKDFYDI